MTDRTGMVLRHVVWCVTPELIFLPYASTTRVIGCSPMMDPYLGRVVLSQSTLIRALMSE
jgi:hypothetical protein